MNYCSIHNSFLFTYLKHIIHNPVIIIFSLQNIAKKKVIIGQLSPNVSSFIFAHGLRPFVRLHLCWNECLTVWLIMCLFV